MPPTMTVRVALCLRGGKGGTYTVIPRVVEPDGPQDEHGQDNEEATETHRIQTSEGRSQGQGVKRESFLGFAEERNPSLGWFCIAI